MWARVDDGGSDPRPPTASFAADDERPAPGSGTGRRAVRMRREAATRGCQRQRIVMMKPAMSRTKPTPRFQTPMDPIGYLYSLT